MGGLQNMDYKLPWKRCAAADRETLRTVYRRVKIISVISSKKRLLAKCLVKQWGSFTVDHGRLLKSGKYHSKRYQKRRLRIKIWYYRQYSIDRKFSALTCVTFFVSLIVSFWRNESVIWSVTIFLIRDCPKRIEILQDPDPATSMIFAAHLRAQRVAVRW